MAAKTRAHTHNILLQYYNIIILARHRRRWRGIPGRKSRRVPRRVKKKNYGTELETSQRGDEYFGLLGRRARVRTKNSVPGLSWPSSAQRSPHFYRLGTTLSANFFFFPRAFTCGTNVLFVIVTARRTPPGKKKKKTIFVTTFPTFPKTGRPARGQKCTRKSYCKNSQFNAERAWTGHAFLENSR